MLVCTNNQINKIEEFKKKDNGEMSDTEQVDICIVGAGLTGLLMAYRLEQAGKKVIIVESRNRIGGRIFTDVREGQTPVEMGATWFSRQHDQLQALLKELKVGIFEQVIGRQAVYEATSMSPFYMATLPENQEPSYRVQGGTMQIIQALADKLVYTKIYLESQVKTIKDNQSLLELSIEDKLGLRKIEASQVVSTLPPNLLVNTVSFEPQLSKDFIAVAKKTHTWMGESIKIALRFKEPFWRKTGSSGTIFSNVGPVTEMYDHSDYKDEHYALMGFLNGSYHSVSKEERKAIVLNQLEKYYGKIVFESTEYIETVWTHEKSTYKAYDSNVVPHQFQGHPIYQQALYKGKLLLAGTETSSQYSGYMEGAVRSGEYVVGLLNV